MEFLNSCLVPCTPLMRASHITPHAEGIRQGKPLEEKRGPLKGSACFLTGLIARQPTTLNLDLGIHREDCGASNHRTAATL
jgi:hypothetical protein